MNSSSDLILAIETSCDDTSVALVRRDLKVLDLISANQDIKHQVFGGIVPEVASRAHVETLTPLISELLKKHDISSRDLKALAVTTEPGLLGPLLVGVVTAKSLSLAWKKPLIPVHHIEGHLFSSFLDQAEPFQFPFLGLVVSGGHTSLVNVRGVGQYHLLGSTKDDAAGEAFDKTAKMLGLGYPGGAKLDQLAQKTQQTHVQEMGQALSLSLPQLSGLDFSFSGIKTAIKRVIDQQIENLKKPTDLWTEQERAPFAYALQKTVIGHLMDKLQQAVQQIRPTQIAVVGGVSSNSELRRQVEVFCKTQIIRCVIPELKYCTDNAAMIGAVGWLKFSQDSFQQHGLSQILPSARTTAQFGFYV